MRSNSFFSAGSIYCFIYLYYFLFNFMLTWKTKNVFPMAWSMRRVSSYPRCYQCGKCTAGCVLAEEMDFPPSFLVRLLQIRTPENDNRVLGSNAIWICLNCENCIARCPKEIDIPKIMDYLREQSRHRNCINKQSRPVVAFHSAFLQSVRYTGRCMR